MSFFLQMSEGTLTIPGYSMTFAFAFAPSGPSMEPLVTFKFTFAFVFIFAFPFAFPFAFVLGQMEGQLLLLSHSHVVNMESELYSLVIYLMVNSRFPPPTRPLMTVARTNVMDGSLLCSMLCGKALVEDFHHPLSWYVNLGSCL